MEAEKRAVGIDLAKRSMEVRFMKDGEKTVAWNCKTDAIGREKLYKLRKGDVVGIEACALAFKIAREIKEKTGRNCSSTGTEEPRSRPRVNSGTEESYFSG
jgi:hypothetical protein